MHTIVGIRQSTAGILSVVVDVVGDADDAGVGAVLERLAVSLGLRAVIKA